MTDEAYDALSTETYRGMEDDYVPCDERNNDDDGYDTGDEA